MIKLIGRNLKETVFGFLPGLGLIVALFIIVGGFVGVGYLADLAVIKWGDNVAGAVFLSLSLIWIGILSAIAEVCFDGR